MLQIPCPWCGIRDETDFNYGGTADVRRPPFECSDQEWSDYLFCRDNPKGVHRERWFHGHGCGRWFHIVRDTATHQILDSTPPGDGDPDAATQLHA